jgi:subtilisin family serine protease
VIPDNNNICLLIARAFGDADGGTPSSNINAAMEWCGMNDARVINMSLGSGSFSRTQQLIVRALQDQGVLIVAAMGNLGTTDYNYPAAYNESIGVGAVDSNLTWANFSQFNDQVDVCAPGVRINSTVPSLAIIDNSNNATYDASLMDGSLILSDILVGDLADCGLGLERCEDVSGKICFIERGEGTFAVKATNCEDGGGIGSIIFNNVGSSDVVQGTLGDIVVGIPVVAISRSAGLSFSLASLPSITIDVRSASYRSQSGTSMATPHVTGVVARIWSVRPECTSAQVREAVENTVLDLGDAGRDDLYGKGLVQMEAAYEYLLSLDAPCGRVGAVEEATDLPTIAPTKKPTNVPTNVPTKAPTKSPTNKPTVAPTREPTSRPNPSPTRTRSPIFTFSPVSGGFQNPQTPQSIFPSPPPQTPQSFFATPPGGFTFSVPSPADVFFQNGSTGDEDESVTDGSADLSAAKDDGQGDAVSNNVAAFTSSACNDLPSVGRVAISVLMAILLTVV